MSEILPRAQTELFGHEATESLLLADLASGKLAHGIILSGPRGIGKSTLAYRFARALLSGAQHMELSPEHPVFRRIAAGSHADLLVIEQLYDEKKEEYAREISAEQARAIPEALSFTPGEGQWRMVIIDSADALTNAAANAILKILEEPPPQTVLLLVSHNAGRLLPTIRSRCRTIAMKPLMRSDFNRAMRLVAPEIYGEELAALAMLSENSPGVALELHAQGALTLYKDTLSIFSSAGALDTLELHRFAEQVSASKTHTNWQIFTQITLNILERASKQAAGMSVDVVSEEEGQALAILANMHSAEIWANKWQEAARQFSLAQRLHLDYKQLVLVFFHSLKSEEASIIE